MLDGKVLAAVFATLTAIGAAMNGGAVDTADLQPQNIDSSNGFNIQEYLPESLSVLSELQRNPEPTKHVEADLRVDGLQSQKIRVADGSLHASNVTSADIGGRNVNSDEKIVFYGFTGNMLPGKPTKIEGRGKGYLTSGVNVSGSFKANQEFETDLIKAEDVKRAKISLKDVKGTIESNTTSTQITDSGADLEISSFSGNISVRPHNDTVKLSGKIAELEAGDISFGG